MNTSLPSCPICLSAFLPLKVEVLRGGSVSEKMPRARVHFTPPGQVSVEAVTHSQYIKILVLITEPKDRLMFPNPFNSSSIAYRKNPCHKALRMQATDKAPQSNSVQRQCSQSHVQPEIHSPSKFPAMVSQGAGLSLTIFLILLS